ncbi:palmitoyltransferase ZDHHC15 [Drosophila subobscura]|uniref:palmitoyltransferase ZDHHC15 n=1 Tax=Drosophila subobscura TaxID=7241 RepID=UPI00155A6342|nr:palmitoyltransferase ZDHHC15 [Drosophila subobscura]
MIDNPSGVLPTNPVPIVAQLAIEYLTENSEDEYRQRRSGRATCCSGFDCFLRWIPVIFMGAVLVYSYYVYVWHLCLQKMTNAALTGVLLLWYHLLLLMFLWTYWRTLWTQCRPIPEEWSIPEADWMRLQRADGPEERRRVLAAIARALPITMCDQNGVVRYCVHCRLIKPDRAHHCRSCGCCILKMDHHCPWVNNCVHFHNYKCFLLFLLYSSLYCLDILVTLLLDLHQAWGIDFDNVDLDSLLTIIPMVFALIFTAAALIMLGMHIYLVLLNRTTMESAHSPTFCVGGRTRQAFDLGCCENLREVFGDRWYLWPLPIYSSRGDGLTFSTSHKSRDGSGSSASSTGV